MRMVLEPDTEHHIVVRRILASCAQACRSCDGDVASSKERRSSSNKDGRQRDARSRVRKNRAPHGTSALLIRRI